MKLLIFKVVSGFLLWLGIISPASPNLGAPSQNLIVSTSSISTIFANGRATTTIQPATTTFAGNVSIIGRTTLFGGLNSSSTATSTFANGLQLDAGCVRVQGSCLGSGNVTGTGVAGQPAVWDSSTNLTASSTLSESVGGTGTTSPRQFLFGQNGLIISTSTIAQNFIDGAIARDSELHNAVTLAGENYLSLSGQQITANAIGLGGTNVTGTLLVGNGGTGNTTFNSGQLIYGNNANALKSVATSSASCSGSVSCSSFDVVGSVSPNITSSAALFAWTPTANGNSTSTRLLFGNGFISSASSTVSSQLTVNGQLQASSTLLVNNLSTLTGGFISSASSTVAGPLQVAGPIQASSSVSVKSLSIINLTTTNNENLSDSVLIRDSTGNIISDTLTYDPGGDVLNVGTNPLVLGGTTIRNSSGNLSIKVADDASSLLLNQSGGNVGIGTTSPGTLLSLGNTGANTINISPTATSTFGSGLNLRTGCFAIGGTCVAGGSSGTVGAGTTGQTAFYSSTDNVTGTSTVFIASDRNVGIGTTSPIAKLEIAGKRGIQNEGQLLVTGLADHTYIQVRSDSPVTKETGLQFVGLGTPNAPDWGIKIAANSSNLQFVNVSSSTVVMELHKGRVGIGTTSAGTLLSLGTGGDGFINLIDVATSTFGRGINLKSGCFSIRENCVAGLNNQTFTGTTTVAELALSGTGLTDMGSSTPRTNTLYKENIVKAWVRFDAVSTVPVIADAFNVSSITDNGLGLFTANWNVSFNTKNYAAVCTGAQSTSLLANCGVIVTTASTAQMDVENETGTGRVDPPILSLIAIGDQ